MKGIYKTKEGSKVEVIDFDEANKIALIKLSEQQNKWVDESEYSTWEKYEEPEASEELLEEEVVVEEELVADDEVQLTEQEEQLAGEIATDFENEVKSDKPKKKRTIKKKTK